MCNFAAPRLCKILPKDQDTWWTQWCFIDSLKEMSSLWLCFHVKQYLLSKRHNSASSITLETETLGFRNEHHSFNTTWHYGDVMMRVMASQITSLTIVYSTVYSCVDQRKHQSSASLAFVKGIRRWPVISQRKGPVSRKMFPLDEVIMVLFSPVVFLHWYHLYWLVTETTDSIYICYLKIHWLLDGNKTANNLHLAVIVRLVITGEGHDDAQTYSKCIKRLETCFRPRLKRDVSLAFQSMFCFTKIVTK